MLVLGKKPATVPPILQLPTVPPGRVFVATEENRRFAGQLEEGKAAVLEVEGGRLELTTIATVRSSVGAPGTYLNPADIYRLDGAEKTPRLRRYTLRDTFGKAWSRSGVILLIVTALGLFSAAAALVLAVAGESSTSARAVAERSQTLLSWAVEPAEGLEGADERKVSAARRAVSRREAQAQTCMRSLGGGEASEAQPGGVSCIPQSPPWWKDKDKGALLALLIALVTTLLGLFGVVEKFGFRRSPAS